MGGRVRRERKRGSREGEEGQREKESLLREEEMGAMPPHPVCVCLCVCVCVKIEVLERWGRCPQAPAPAGSFRGRCPHLPLRGALAGVARTSRHLELLQEVKEGGTIERVEERREEGSGGS